MSASTPRPVAAGSRRPGRRRGWVAIAAVVVLVVTGVVLWWLKPGVPRAADGETVALAGDTLTEPGSRLALAHSTRVVTPAYAVEIRLGEPVDELEPEVLAGDDADPPPSSGNVVDDHYLAGRGSEFWPVEWASAGEPPPSEARARTAERPAEPLPAATLALAVDGEVVAGPYALDDSPSAAALDQRSIAVAADGDVTVEVTYDGVTQVVDASTGELDAGVAAANYDDDLAGGETGADSTDDPPRCRWHGDLPRGVRFSSFACSVTGAASSPWDPAEGWVDEPGQVWTSVDLHVGSYGQVPVDGELYLYDTEGRLGRPTLDGDAPDRLERSELDVRLEPFGQQVYATWLLDAPVSPVSLRMSGTLRLTRPADTLEPLPVLRVPVTVDLVLPPAV